MLEIRQAKASVCHMITIGPGLGVVNAVQLGLAHKVARLLMDLELRSGSPAPSDGIGPW
jgi:hypothetical protein